MPHTLSIDFAANPQDDPHATAEDIVMAGIEVGGCLVSAADGLGETRHGPTVPDTKHTQLCIDVHQVRPDPFNSKRYAWQLPAQDMLKGQHCHEAFAFVSLQMVCNLWLCA